MQAKNLELDTCIKGRRSVRAYTEEPASKVTLKPSLKLERGHRRELNPRLVKNQSNN
jgi:nitroreductase